MTAPDAYMIFYNPNYVDADFHVHAYDCRDNSREARDAVSSWPYSGSLKAHALGLECMGDVATDTFNEGTTEYDELVTEWGYDLVRIMPCVPA